MNKLLKIIVPSLFLLCNLAFASSGHEQGKVTRFQKNFLKCMVQVLEERKLNSEDVLASTELALQYRESFNDRSRVNDITHKCRELKNKTKKNEKKSREEFQSIVNQVVTSYPLYPFYYPIAKAQTRYLCMMNHLELRAAAIVGLGLGVSGGICRGENGKIKLAFGPAISLTVGLGVAAVVHRELRILDGDRDHISSVSIRDPSLYTTSAVGGGIVYHRDDSNHTNIYGGAVGVSHLYSAGLGLMSSGITVGRDWLLLHNNLTHF